MGFEWNKIAGAFLAAAFVVLGVNFLSDGLYHADVPETYGYAIEGGEVEVAAGGDAGPAYEPVAPLLASADIAGGENVAKKCVACHNFNEGGANKVGPALYGIVNRAIASVDGFGYSNALKEYAEGKTWTYDELNGFLWKPKTHVKGTSMGFAGLKKVEDRAEIIAYLRSLDANPAPLPDPAAAAPTAAEGATDTPMKDAEVVTPAPGNATIQNDVNAPSGGATGTQLTPKVEEGAADQPLQNEDATPGEAPKASE